MYMTPLMDMFNLNVINAGRFNFNVINYEIRNINVEYRNLLCFSMFEDQFIGTYYLHDKVISAVSELIKIEKQFHAKGSLVQHKNLLIMWIEKREMKNIKVLAVLAETFPILIPIPLRYANTTDTETLVHSI